MDEFYETFSNMAIKEEDDLDPTPDAFDPYLSMELSFDRGGENKELAHVTKRLKDSEGNPIGHASSNPLLDTRLYEVAIV